MLTDLYARFQNGKNIIFSIDDVGKLHARIEENSKSQTITRIKGVPDEFKLNLNLPDKLEKLLEFLKHHAFFCVVGNELDVHVRGVGGWSLTQHAGFFYNAQSFLPETLEENVLDFRSWLLRISWGTLTPVTYHDSFGEGTYLWAYNVGFSVADSTAVGAACGSVDFGKTRPTSIFFGLEPQSWHFNINQGKDNIPNPWSSSVEQTFLTCNAGGSPGDSRIIHTVELLRQLLEKKGGYPTPLSRHDVLSKLGVSLHPLQDVYAHADEFVTKDKIPRPGMSDMVYFSHVNHQGQHADQITPTSQDDRSEIADDCKPTAVNKRYSNAKTATYLLLLVFLYAKENFPIFNKQRKNAGTFFGRIRYKIMHTQLKRKERIDFLDAFYDGVKKNRLNKPDSIEPFLGLLTAMNQANILSYLPNCPMKADIETALQNISPKTKHSWTTSDVTDYAIEPEDFQTKITRFKDTLTFFLNQNSKAKSKSYRKQESQEDLENQVALLKESQIRKTETLTATSSS